MVDDGHLRHKEGTGAGATQRWQGDGGRAAPQIPPGMQQPLTPLTRIGVCCGGTHSGGWKGGASSMPRAWPVSGGRSWPAMAVGSRDGARGLPVPCGGKRLRSRRVLSLSAGCSPPVALPHHALPEGGGAPGSPISAAPPPLGTVPCYSQAPGTLQWGDNPHGTVPSPGSLTMPGEEAVPSQNQPWHGSPMCSPCSLNPPEWPDPDHPDPALQHGWIQPPWALWGENTPGWDRVTAEPPARHPGAAW